MRVAEIRWYVEAFRSVAGFLTETDYPAVAKILAGWKAGPAEDRARVVEVLAAQLDLATFAELKNNAELWVSPRRNPRDPVPKSFTDYTDHDVHIAGGRAAWGIEVLTGVRVPRVTGKADDEERSRDKQTIRWAIVPAFKAGVRQGRAARAEPK
jgi:hypothetical protein